jgi:hypothetical protein
MVRAKGTDQTSKNADPLEAIMDGSRNERARARARHLLAQIAPLPDDAEVQRLRELSMDYIREAERIEKEGVTTVESAEHFGRLGCDSPQLLCSCSSRNESKGSSPTREVRSLSTNILQRPGRAWLVDELHINDVTVIDVIADRIEFC